MEIFGRQIDLKHSLRNQCLFYLVILDVFLITVALIFDIPDGIVADIRNFDFIVCIILLFEYAFSLYHAPSKRDYILDPINILTLIASIPFDFILGDAVPRSGILGFLRLLRLVSVVLLSSRTESVKTIFKKTGIHKIMLWFVVTVILFTALFFFFGPSFGGIDDLYFVIVTLTTVGYGDVTPVTHNQKVLAMILILIGMALVSTITAVMSSFLTDRILENEDDEIRQAIEEKSESLTKDLMMVSEENRQLKEEVIKQNGEIGQLKDEIHELKELIKNK